MNRKPQEDFYAILIDTSAKDCAIQYYKTLAPGPAKPDEATEAYKDDELTYSLSRVPTVTPRPPKIIAVGAGFSGLA
ncbi:uncharacterized protein FFB14_01588 [Fusarium fujikuroi]|nr:uncharacterized protein FFB14_01588 [Fusarium fujikuroi]